MTINYWRNHFLRMQRKIEGENTMDERIFQAIESITRDFLAEKSKYNRLLAWAEAYCASENKETWDSLNNYERMRTIFEVLAANFDDAYNGLKATYTDF
jgi:hypothetical protein